MNIIFNIVTLKQTKNIKIVLEKLKKKNKLILFADIKSNEFLKYFHEIYLLDYSREEFLLDSIDALIESENKPAEEFLYIGGKEILKIMSSGIKTGLALWIFDDIKHVKADYYFQNPYTIWNTLTLKKFPYKNKKWLEWAMELQFLAQAGLTYSKDIYDKERFERIREVSAEIMSFSTDTDILKITDLYSNEIGYQTPKLDTRAAIFENDKILLVKENDGLWSLPGGWVDSNMSVMDNTIKEVYEEAGLNVICTKIIGILDRKKHNPYTSPFGITKVFVMCKIIDGEFKENIETLESSFFEANQLPELSLGKNTKEQVQMCFDAYNNPHWETIFD